MVVLRRSDGIKKLLRTLAIRDSNLDMEFVCADGRLKCHKLVLAAQSQFLKNILLSVPNSEGETCHVFLPDVSVNSLKVVLQFLYSGKLVVTEAVGKHVRDMITDVLKIDVGINTDAQIRRLVSKPDEGTITSREALSEIQNNSFEVERTSSMDWSSTEEFCIDLRKSIDIKNVKIENDFGTEQTRTARHRRDVVHQQPQNQPFQDQNDAVTDSQMPFITSFHSQAVPDHKTLKTGNITSLAAKGPSQKRFFLAARQIKGNTSNRAFNNIDAPYCCDMCGMAYSKKSSLIFHKSRFHNPRLKHPCPECKKLLSSKHSIEKHLLSHRPEEEWPYQCKFCSKHFQAKSDLPKHFLTARHRNDPRIPVIGSQAWKELLDSCLKLGWPRKSAKRSRDP